MPERLHFSVVSALPWAIHAGPAAASRFSISTTEAAAAMAENIAASSMATGVFTTLTIVLRELTTLQRKALLTHAEVYQQRPPIHHAEKLNCPVVFFQGIDDKVVRPAQSSLMVKAAEENAIYQELWEFQNEGNGFLEAKTIATALEAGLAFYIKTLGL
jgi:dipeptidyl aminopeptidase/acylaminoacyl peptidase